MPDALDPTAVAQPLAVDPRAVTQGLNSRLASLERRLTATENLARASVREQFRARDRFIHLEDLIAGLQPQRLLSERSTIMDDLPDLVPKRVWLEDLILQWGEPLLVRLDDPVTRHGSPVTRSVWSWAPGHVNHLLTVERYEAPWIEGHRWLIVLEANETPTVQVVTADCRGTDQPDALIRLLLVAAGWLMARPPGCICLACNGTGTDDGRPS
jgi:hypothetical protein